MTSGQWRHNREMLPPESNFIPKPYDPAEVIEFIHELFRNNK